MTVKNTPVDDYIADNSPPREKIIISVQRNIDKWLFTLPTGDDIELPTLKVCEKLIWQFHKKAQFRDVDFILIDGNTGTHYTDHRKFTDYIKACRERQSLIDANRKRRAQATPVKRTRTRKVDMRAFDRNY